MHHAKVSPRQANCTENAYDYFAMNNKTGVEDRKQTKKKHTQQTLENIVITIRTIWVNCMKCAFL